jgi:hypothetical protein
VSHKINFDGCPRLDEATADYDWWVLSAEGLAAELAAASLDIRSSLDDLIVARRPAG